MRRITITNTQWTIAFWGCAVVVLALALSPAPPRAFDTGWDKTNHLLAFVVLTLLGRRAYPAHLVAMLAGLLLYGGVIEILQSFVPTRFAEWMDLLTDAAGIGIGAGLYAGIQAVVRRGEHF